MSRTSLVQLLRLTVFVLGPALSLSVMEPALISYRLLRLELAAETRPALYGALTFVGLVTASVVQPLAGRWSGDARALRRRTTFMVAGAVCAVTGLAMIMASASLPGLFGGVVLTQAGANVALAAWQPVISERIVQERRGLAAGLRNGAELLAASLGRLFAAEITAQAATGYRELLPALLVLPALTFAAASPITFRALRTTSLLAPETRTAHPTPSATRIPTMLRNRAFRLWFVNRATFWCAAIMSSAFLLFVAMDALGLSEPEAQRFVAQLIVIAGIAVALTLLPAAWLADRLGRQPLLLAAGSVAALGALSIVIDRASVTFATVCIAASTGIFLSASLALAGDLAPRHNAAPYLGLANLATTLGSATGRLVGGALVSLTGVLTQTRVEGYIALYAAAAGLFALSALSAARLRSALADERG